MNVDCVLILEFGSWPTLRENLECPICIMNKLDTDWKFKEVMATLWLLFAGTTQQALLFLKAVSVSFEFSFKIETWTNA